MTTDAPLNASAAAAPPNPPANDPAAVGIVSVNDRGRRQSGRFGPFLMMGGVALVVLIGGLLTVNVVKARLSGPKSTPVASNAASAGLIRTFATEAAPPLPGTAGAPSASGSGLSAACPDGTAGNELRGQDGIVVRNA